MRTCDVIVVGGGPAGSSCARRLRQHELDVVVLDQARFPRDKVCAGWITPQVIEALDLDLADYARGRVLQPITGFRTGLLGRNMLLTRYDGPVSYAIRRYEFDDYLLRRSGAELATGQALHELNRVDGFWIANATFRAPMLVGAGGHTCPVARRMAHKPVGELPLILAKEVEIALDPDASTAIEPGTPELYFCHDLKGYGWCVRKQGWLNVGLGREDPRDLSRHVADFVAGLQRAGHIPAFGSHLLRGHAYLLSGHGSRPWPAAGVRRAGDAPGLAGPQSGEGIGPAVESGQLAAEVIADCRGDFRASRLQAYQALLIRKPGRPSGKLSMTFNPDVARSLGALLLGSRFLTRSLLLNRWFLHRMRWQRQRRFRSLKQGKG